MNPLFECNLPKIVSTAFLFRPGLTILFPLLSFGVFGLWPLKLHFLKASSLNTATIRALANSFWVLHISVAFCTLYSRAYTPDRLSNSLT